MDFPTEKAIQELKLEREMQRIKYGLQRHSGKAWAALIAERGALTLRAARYARAQEYRKLLVETAALAVAALESYDAVGFPGDSKRVADRGPLTQKKAESNIKG